MALFSIVNQKDREKDVFSCKIQSKVHVAKCKTKY